ncbi:MAG: type 4a pilus biogenesis protein PilO [Candidatus Omnitrophica bacterium]|nr:type 4a pilus biogenesis protein PilO [Candidatus Omnitrophota bacterium]
MEENKRDFRASIADGLGKIEKFIPDRIKKLFTAKEYRGYMILAIAGIILFVYLISAVIPKLVFLGKTSIEIKDLKAKIELVDSRIGRIDVLTKKFEKLTTEINGYSVGLPEQKELPEFIEELSLTAKTSGVKILSITPKEPKDIEKAGEYYKEVPIEITAESGYHELASFIGNLEGSKRFVTIEDLLIKSDVKDPRKHDITIKLKTYVYVAG